MLYRIVSSADKKLTYFLLSMASVFSIILILQTGNTKEFSEKSLSCFSSEDRINYFMSYGWIVDAGSENAEEIILPIAANNMFNEYNRIQKLQGYDLFPWLGKKVVRYTYALLNFPGYENMEGMYATVLAGDGEIIASDIFNASPNGFMLGVKTGIDYDEDLL